MKIVINERQENILKEYVSSNFRDKLKNIESEKAQLENYIEASGEYMTDITNGKTYMVQYLKALSELVGKGYAMCAPVRNDGTYGAFYVKPYDTFQKKENGYGATNSGYTTAKPSLYSQMLRNSGE